MSDLRIVSARITRLDVPSVQPYVSSQTKEGKASGQRTVIRLEASDGTVGIGETVGRPEVWVVVKRICEGLIGHDPLDLNRLRRTFAPKVFENRSGQYGWMALAGVEIACWDLAGKHFGLPVYEMLGGLERREIETACLLGALPLERQVTVEELADLLEDESNIARVIEEAEARVAEHGFRTIKIKSAGLNLQWDAQVMRALRDAFGPRMKLRMDPNGAWTVSEALRLGKALEPLDLEYFEDPTDGIESMARLRRDLRIPFATNMCVIDFDQLAVGIRMHAIDAVLSSYTQWGGLKALQELAAVCRTFGLSMGINSHGELGVGIAAKLHFAAATRQVKHAMDGVLHHYDATLVEGSPLDVHDGLLTVPDGPGLGVSLDEAEIGRLRVEEHAM